MRPIGLIIATAALAVLGGLVWWSNKNKKDEPVDGAPVPTAQIKVLLLNKDEFAKVEIARRELETTRVERDSAGAWRITAPENFATDSDAVYQWTSALSTLNADKVIEEKPADLASFGLAAPAATITVTLKNGKTHTVKLGDEAPVGGGTFAQTGDSARVVLLASTTRGSLDKLAVDLRDKRLVTFDETKLARLTLNSMEFSRNQQNEWVMVKPAPFRADGWQVEELLRKIKDTRLDPMLTSDQKADLAKQFNSAAPLATIGATGPAGTQTFEVRKTKDGKYYARSSVVDGFHLLAGDSGPAFDKKPEDFRNKKLFDFAFNDPTKVEYKDAARQVAFTKSGEKWMANLKAMDTVGVQSLIDQLRELQAASFPAGGFTTPAIEIAVTSKTTERISISKSGDKYIARREGEPALYEIAATAVAELQKAAAGVKEEPKAAKK